MDKKMKIKVQLRIAVPEDLKVNNTTLRIGQPYVILNGDGKTFSGFHIISGDTDPMELKHFLISDRILVPMSCLDSKIELAD